MSSNFVPQNPRMNAGTWDGDRIGMDCPQQVVGLQAPRVLYVD